MLRQFTAVATLVAAALSVGDAAHYHFKVSKEATTTPSSLTATANGTSTTNSSSPAAIQDANTWHMKQVTSIQARIQGDQPYWDADTKLWVSKYGTTIDERYASVLDTVNTASVEGALMFVQAEGINKAEQSVPCQRKNSMQYVVFYEMSIVQPTYAIAESQDHSPVEYTPFVAMDTAKCTPTDGETLPKECKQYYGLDGELKLGPSVGAESKTSDPRAPYPNNYWFSYPSGCADQLRDKKTPACRAEHAGGLCPRGSKPDGVQCTFTYKILGYLNLDDLVGITSMKSAAGVTYANYTQFCNDGGVEFDATNSNGFTVKQSLKFWEKPGDSDANVQRATDMVTMYNELAPNAKTGEMTALPTVAALAAANPKCYENSEKCASAKAGCRRTLYAQLCEVCEQAGDGCEVAPADFKYPTLVRPTQAPTPAPGKGKKSGSGGDDATIGSDSDTQSSASTLLSMGIALTAVAAASLL